MDYSLGERCFKNGERLYAPLLALEVLLGSVSIATAIVRGTFGPPPPPPPGQTYVPSFGLGGRTVNCGISIPEAMVLPLVSRNVEPSEVVLWFVNNKMPPHIAANPEVITSLQKPFDFALSAVFGNFYEAHKHLLPSDHTLWPITDFGRVLRNAMAHGGNIFFDKPTRRSVAWRSIRYAHADNGRSLADDLSFADLIFLMMEMSEEMDALGLEVP